MTCPTTQVFHELVAGHLGVEDRARIADHASTCTACHDLVAALVAQHSRVQPQSAPLVVGTVIGRRFRIEEILGVGGMGFVVAATHLELGHKVALKFMREELLASPAIVERFVREARAVVRLHTEHVCRVLDVGRLDSGAPYIVMELLEGTDLARTLVRGPLPVTLAVEYVMQACVALAEAHGLGIVHRDLKPANLFVTRRPDGGPLVKVLDFGIAKAITEDGAGITHTRMVLGSPGFMSPEQLVSPKDVDHRTDIWALGVTLYQLLSARLPFVATSETEVAMRIVGEAPPPLAVDPTLARVVMCCLEKSREHRFANVGALAAALAPFGGPGAPRLATAIRHMTGGAPTLGTAATVPAMPMPGAPTSATAAATPSPPRAHGASPMAGASAVPLPTTSPRRSRALLIVAPIAAVLGAVIAVVAMSMRGGGSQSEGSGVAMGSAAGSIDAPGSSTVAAASSTGGTDAPASSTGGTDAPVSSTVAGRDAGIDASPTAHHARDAAVAHQALDAHPAPDAPKATIAIIDAGEVRDSIDEGNIAAGLEPIFPKWAECAQQSNIHEAFTVTVAIAPTGKLASVHIAGKLDKSAFASCLNWVARDGKWPASKAGGSATFPLDLR